MKLISWVVLVCLCSSCIPAPTVPEAGHGSIGGGGMWVVCEGLWRQNNAALSYIQVNGVVIRDAMRYVNGSGLGDTPSDAIVVGDTIVIAVNTSRKIVLCSKSTGRLLASIAMPPGKEPYRLAYRDGRVWCTNLNDDSISELNLNTGSFSVSSKHIGPAPEGIAIVDSMIYVALSGFGDLRKSESRAGSVLVVHVRDLSVQDSIVNLPNVGALVADQQRHLLWCAFRNYASTPDVPGGVVLFDTQTNVELQRWAFNSPTRICTDTATGNAFILHTNGVDMLTPGTSASQHILEHKSTAANDVWYSLGYDHVNQHLIVGNARSYVTDGEVLVYTLNGQLVNRYGVGSNPTCIVK